MPELTDKQTSELSRLRQAVAAMREQMNARLDVLDALIVAMLPPAHANAARYQRQRVISADRKKIKEFMES